MDVIQEFIDMIKEYTNNFSTGGIIKMSVDVILSVTIIIIFIRLFKVKMHSRWLYLVVIGFILLFAATYILQMKLLLTIFKFLLFWSLGIIIILYSQEVKRFFENNFRNARVVTNQVTEEEKKRIIDVLTHTSSYLSKRKIGALITIEREDSLNSIIEKAIQINGDITEELLTTIFTVGTATHDGAVIVRSNKIMCAGAYLPSTDKYDIPKSLGTRHRAAIGVSERYDAFTIVVSEETGNISTTIDGSINQNITPEKLSEALERYISVK